MSSKPPKDYPSFDEFVDRLLNKNAEKPQEPNNEKYSTFDELIHGSDPIRRKQNVSVM